MNGIYTIIRYKSGQLLKILYPSSDASQEDGYRDVLHFIKTHLEQAFNSQQPFSTQYSTQEQFFTAHFIPEKEEGVTVPQVLVIVQATENLALHKQDITSFAAHLKLFFQKGAHDIKNLFSNMTLLLQGNFIEKAQLYLNDLQDYYLQQIEDFYSALEVYINTEKPAPPQIKAIDFQSLVADVMVQYPSLLNETLVFETNFQSCPHIIYREDYLRNMLKSLIDNAIRYRVEGRPLIIHMNTERRADDIIFLIEDNGTGIDMHRYKGKLFMPFQRFTQQSNGQGISLHLIKLMAEKNGGSIKIESTLHQGTQVTLTLKEYSP